MTITSRYDGTCKACGGAIKTGDDVEWSRGKGARHVDQAACDASTKPQAPKPTATAKLQPIIDFMNEAKGQGLKSPKLRVLDSDGQSEIRLSFSGGQSKVPGSIIVKRNDAYQGVIRPTGEVFARPGLMPPELLERLRMIAEAPAVAAKEYAALMGRCSFCGLELTDEGSVEVGYGPVCAKHWGLPHTSKGTPHLPSRQAYAV